MKRTAHEENSGHCTNTSNASDTEMVDSGTVLSCVKCAHWVMSSLPAVHVEDTVKSYIFSSKSFYVLWLQVYQRWEVIVSTMMHSTNSCHFWSFQNNSMKKTLSNTVRKDKAHKGNSTIITLQPTQNGYNVRFSASGEQETP